MFRFTRLIDHRAIDPSSLGMGQRRTFAGAASSAAVASVQGSSSSSNNTEENWAHKNVGNISLGGLIVAIAGVFTYFNHSMMHSLEKKVDDTYAKFDGTSKSLEKKIDGNSMSLEKKIDVMTVSLDAKLEGQDRTIHGQDRKIDGQGLKIDGLKFTMQQ